MNTNYICVPNDIIKNTALKGAAFTVALYLYALHGANDKNSIKVKQATVAARCGNIDVRSVQNACDTLIAEGIIERDRTIRPDRTYGTYTYTLPEQTGSYTYIPKQAISIILNARNISNRLKSTLMRLYAILAMNRENYSNKFFKSYKGISAALCVSEKRAVNLVDILCKLRVLHKYLRKTKCGDYTHNRYYVSIFVTGTIKRKRRQKKRNGIRSTVSPSIRLFLKLRRPTNDAFLDSYDSTYYHVCQGFW